MNDTISEQDGELSPGGKTKYKHQNSPRKNKLRLPDLHHRYKKHLDHKNTMFKQHMNEVTGVVPVLRSISNISKNNINFNRSMITKGKSKRVNHRAKAPKSINVSMSPKNTKNCTFSHPASRSPVWDRLSRPRFISPPMSTQQSVETLEHIMNLPEIKNMYALLAS